ncbi:MAG: type II toxin-antitoxin system HicB family antitoxin [Propionibacteriales bacterium]|nr:type II toxin-antitoxin system HicB family antitoxin [Propionibacteriales bacterium]
MVDVDHYTFRVSWSTEDGEFIGTCLELPSLSWLSESQGEALLGIRVAAAEVVADLSKSGESVPIPLADRKFSGKFNVRITPQLHRELAMEAAENGLSLNRLANDRLARRS